VTEQIHRVHALQDTNERDDPSDHEGGRPIDPANAFNPGFRVQQCEYGAQPEGDYAEIRLVSQRETGDDGENQDDDAHERHDLM
jgi:hypothetical protein